MEDAACVLGLPKKDFGRPPNVNQLDGLSSKQLAYALSCIDASVSASDVLECGGEHVPWLRANGFSCCSSLDGQVQHVPVAYTYECQSLQLQCHVTSHDSSIFCLCLYASNTCIAQEALLQDRLLSARKKRDKAQESTVAFEESCLMS